jgi:hypothetical protein
MDHRSGARIETLMEEAAMKTIISSLIALSVLGLVAVPPGALDAKTFYDRLDQLSH